MKTQEVTIRSDAVNKWATIERSMLAAITAATYLGENNLVVKMMTIKNLAQRNYKEAVYDKLTKKKLAHGGEAGH